MSSSQTADVAIIGGGITGIATAYYLSKRGLRVTLIERDHLAAGSTGRTVAGVRQQGRSRWQLPLMFEAVKRWKTLEEELGAPVGYQQHGHLMLAANEDVLDFFKTGPYGVDEQATEGLDTRIVSREEVLELVPRLKGPFVGGRYTGSDGGAHPQLTVNAYARAAEARGAKLLLGTEAVGLVIEGDRVRGVKTSAGTVEAPFVVNAAGVWAKEVGSWANLDLPITPERGQVLLSGPLPPLVRPYVIHGDLEGQRVYLRQRHDGRIITGLGNPEQKPGWSTDVDPDFESELRRRLRILIPDLADIPRESTWGGLYEVTPDTEFIIDVLQEPQGLVLACGFSAQGFGPGPAVGDLLAEWIATGKRPELLAPFSPERFKRGTVRKHRLLGEMSGKSDSGH
ncbi:MAG: FAD-binding oxidoreductase [Ardenticatenaceae bacterium]|nr:FAD-binding oxidoreductase [Ardenticatenaceae bacterium]HBY95150.1 hypothetical protein [Chloroflexota bacterium]